jgi:hypothetical protein
MVSLAEDGWSKVMSGMTSAPELLRVAPRPLDIRTLCHVCGSAIGSDFAGCAVCGARLRRSCSYLWTGPSAGLAILSVLCPLSEFGALGVRAGTHL